MLGLWKCLLMLSPDWANYFLYKPFLIGDYPDLRVQSRRGLERRDSNCWVNFAEMKKNQEK